MKLNPQYITTYKNNKWQSISSEDLLPGDICILQSTENIKGVDVKNK
jgi:magnesium-transporting ATPase (P-type)